MSRRMPIPNHCDVSGGGRCTPDGDGCCVRCGVATVVCPTCHGQGYHFNGCADGDVDIEDVLERQPTTTGTTLLDATGARFEVAPFDQDTVLACLLAADLRTAPTLAPPAIVTPEQARAHARERAAAAKPRTPSGHNHVHDPLQRPDGSPCKGKIAAQALARIVDENWHLHLPDQLRDQVLAALAPFDLHKLLGRT